MRKKENYIATLILFMAIMSLPFQLVTPQEKGVPAGGYKIVLGERPPINLDKLPPDAWEPGKLKIKLKKGMEHLINADGLEAGAQGYVRTGHPGLDALNREFHVKSYKPHFAALYQTRSATNQFADRHKAWGFNRWFELVLDQDSDIIRAVKQFAMLPEVELAEPEYKKRWVIDELPQGTMQMNAGTKEPSDWIPSDPHFTTQWHYNNTGQQGGTPGADIRLVDAWNIEKGNSNVIIAVIDGGIDFNHQDIAANMWSGIGYNFNYNTTIINPSEHATHVAGTIAAVNNNGIGVSGIAGGSGSGNGVRLMSCQVFTPAGVGNGMHLAPVYAADNGAAISQNSWGYNNPNVYEQSVLDAIDYFNVNGGGTAMTGGLTIFSAGNSNFDQNQYPACYSGALAVAATNNQDIKAYYSNFGSWIDVSAPGGETNVLPQRGVHSTVLFNNYNYFQGTSMACPHVTGVAALIISHRYGIFDAETVSTIMKATADNIDALNPTYSGKLGTGRINAYASLIMASSLDFPLAKPSSFVVTSVNINKISLAWTKNQAQNDVMIVFSLSPVIGFPVSGNSYAVGDNIPGGGTVIYKGSETMFTHSNLQPVVTYYYKAISFNQSNEYSLGVTVKATTQCSAVNTLPFTENFSDGTLPPCWQIVDNQGNGQVWQIGTIPLGLPTSYGKYAYLPSNSYGSGNTQNSDLITPTLDLNFYTNIQLKFYHYYLHHPTSTAKVFYSLDDGVTWTLIQAFTATTPNPALFQVDLPVLAGKSKVRIKWNYIGTFAYHWCVDNIEISGNPSGAVANFNANKLEVIPGEPVTFTDASLSGNYTSWFWNFGVGAVPHTATGPGPHTVTYLTLGYKTISLTLDNTYTTTKTDYIHVIPQILSNSATYTYGDIPTDRNFYLPSGSSSCPGTMVVPIPAGAIIVGVDVAYKMTAIAPASMVQQFSQLRCTSPGGIKEPTLTQGVGIGPGTYSYNRTGLNIANGVVGGGDIYFQLHAGRNAGGTGCNVQYNKVDNNTWTVKVYYYLIPQIQPDFTADKTIVCEGEQIQFTDLTPASPTAWNWEFPGGTPSVSTIQNPVVEYNSAGVYNVSLTVWFGNSQSNIVKNGYISVHSVPEQASQPVGETEVCQNTIQTVYQTVGAQQATSYHWSLIPEQAGSVSGNGLTGIVSWNSGFSGIAEISVKGQNECGQGLPSIPLQIHVAPIPASFPIIQGNPNICKETPENYTCTLVEHATSYQWMLDPETAGTMQITGNNCLINWNMAFTGTASLKVRGVNNCGTGEWSNNMVLSLVNCYSGILPPGWDFYNTGSHDVVMIPSSALISVYGNQIGSGSWIGVFYNDQSEGEKCGGAVPFNTNADLTLITFGNNPSTTQKDGFDPGETYSWKIFDGNTQQAFSAVATYDQNTVNPGGLFGNGQATIEKLQAIINLQLQLIQGWSGFSIPVTPINGSVPELFMEVKDHMVIMQNFQHIYWPGQGINSFPVWSSEFGAQLKMAEQATLNVSGIVTKLSIDLPAGWSYLPILSLCNVDINDIFSNNIDKIEIVKDIASTRIYWPALGINTLGVLKSGKAYFIKLNQPATINFTTCF